MFIGWHLRRKPLSDASASALAETFRALGDLTRVRMLDALARSELCVQDLAARLHLTESAVSHQLRLLRSSRPPASPMPLATLECGHGSNMKSRSARANDRSRCGSGSSGLPVDRWPQGFCWAARDRRIPVRRPSSAMAPRWPPEPRSPC